VRALWGLDLRIGDSRGKKKEKKQKKKKGREKRKKEENRGERIIYIFLEIMIHNFINYIIID
jgi:zinc transporter ZupT